MPGLSFRLRKAQDYTVRSEEPPNPKLDANWAEEIYSWLVRIRLNSSEFPRIAGAISRFGTSESTTKIITRFIVAIFRQRNSSHSPARSQRSNWCANYNPGASLRGGPCGQ